MAVATSSRRTQAERRASTRAQLLDATIDCLAELGYARTSTTEVVRRAGLSRGAQVHHFPTKSELVVAALDHLFERRQAEFREAFAQLPPERHTYDGAIDLLWEIFQGPTFTAWLELVVAARTDPDLRERVVSVTERLDEGVAAIFTDIFPGVGDIEGATLAVRFAFALLEGLALEQLAGCDGDVATPSLETLKLLARLTLPGPT